MVDGRLTLVLTCVLAIFLMASVDGQHRAVAAECSPLAPCPPPAVNGCDINQPGAAGCLSAQHPANPAGPSAPAPAVDTTGVAKACLSDRAAHAKPEICACLARQSVGDPGLIAAWLAHFTGGTPADDEKPGMMAAMIQCSVPEMLHRSP